MKEFSKLKNLETRKDHLINQMVISTGLPVERIEKLYESFSYENDGDFVKINESFSSFIMPSATTFDFENFKKQIIDLSQQIINPQISLEEREKITDLMFKTIQDNCGISVGTTQLLEVICYILLLKNDKFQKISEQISFGKVTKSLFESEKIDFTPINVSKKNTAEQNSINASEDKKLYESLKNILAKNNKRWGYNYHLDNTYNEIVKYLDSEIQELTNMNNVHTVGNTFHMELLKQILTEKQLNQSYRHIDVLRNLIPDIQTLVFDLMLLIHSYTEKNKEVIEFVARDTFIDFTDIEKTLFAAISSSKKSSKIINNSLFSSSVANNFEIDFEKIDIGNNPIQLRSAIDMIHIIKSCETEFNLHLRKVINKYVTKTFNLLASTEKIILRERSIK